MTPPSHHPRNPSLLTSDRKIGMLGIAALVIVLAGLLVGFLLGSSVDRYRASRNQPAPVQTSLKETDTPIIPTDSPIPPSETPQPSETPTPTFSPSPTYDSRLSLEQKNINDLQTATVQAGEQESHNSDSETGNARCEQKTFLNDQKIAYVILSVPLFSDSEKPEEDIKSADITQLTLLKVGDELELQDHPGICVGRSWFRKVTTKDDISGWVFEYYYPHNNFKLDTYQEGYYLEPYPPND